MPAQGTDAPPLGATGPIARPNPLKELASLKFEMKNKALPRLPPNATIQRRPLNHAPIASPYAGANTQKIVYVSRNTPIMSAVKRVKKLLSHIEKRAMQDVDLVNHRNGMKKLAEASEKLAKDGEEVLVKASGRAMAQALKIADWFRTKEDEMRCKVEVRTGSVQVVDDIVEVDVDEATQEGVPKEMEMEPTQPVDSTGLCNSGAEPSDDLTGSERGLPTFRSVEDDGIKIR